MRENNIIAGEAEAEKSLADLLLGKSEKLSRSYLKDQFRNKNILLNNRVPDGGEIIRRGDLITLKIPLKRKVILKNTSPLKILFEDDYILAVDKPAGMAVHPGCGHYSDTLINLLMNHCNLDEYELGSKDKLSFGLVSRLDKNTSGVLIVSKSPQVQAKLQRDKSIKKEYSALVEGRMSVESGGINIPLIRDPENRFRMTADENGRPAETLFKVKERYRKYTLLEVLIITGRTHQIRAHLALSGYPVAGDTLYGGSFSDVSGIRRVMLHSESISFIHPENNSKITITAPLPGDILQALRNLRDYSTKAEPQGSGNKDSGKNNEN